MQDTLFLQPPSVVAATALLLFFSLWWTTSASTTTKKRGFNTVPHVSSLLPYLGCAIEMGMGIRDFVLRYCNKYSTPIFSAIINGRKCYFLTDVTLAHAATKSLDRNESAEIFLQYVCGVSRKELMEMKADDPGYKKAFKLTQHHFFAHKSLETTIPAMQNILFPLMTTSLSSKNWSSMGLMDDFVYNVIFQASVGSQLSSDLTDNPVCLHNFRDFLHGVPFLFIKVPEMFLPKAVAAREAIVAELARGKYLETAAPYLKDRKEKLNMTNNAYDRVVLGNMFALMSNSFDTVFWAIARILKDPEAYSAIQKEVDTMEPDVDGEFYSAEKMDTMTTLQSVFQETLRLYYAGFQPRPILEDYEVKIEGKKYVLEKGCRIMSFPQVLHHDERVFDSPREYRWDRFLDTRQKFRLPNGRMVSDPIKAFGGGGHACPGRRFIVYQFKALMAKLFREFDLRLSDPEGSLPGIDKAMEGVGMSFPDRDLNIEVRRRVV